MSQVVPVNNVLIVEIYNKIKKKTPDSSPFSMPVSSQNLGTVKYSSSEDYPVGSHVFFAGQTERIMIEGVEVVAVKMSDIIAKYVE